jgi:hypothetical protein
MVTIVGRTAYEKIFMLTVVQYQLVDFVNCINQSSR